MTKIELLAAVITIVFLGSVGVIGYYRITGDLKVCKVYYKEMGLMECYWSSKTVRVPNGDR